MKAGVGMVGGIVQRAVSRLRPEFLALEEAFGVVRNNPAGSPPAGLANDEAVIRPKGAGENCRLFSPLPTFSRGRDDIQK